MITAYLHSDAESLGAWDFLTLPHEGETIVVRRLDNQPYIVERVEHFPIPEGYDGSEDAIPFKSRVAIHIRLAGLPR